jgi:uncharacterized protein
VRSVLAQLPLDRVWELHLAGGMEHDGFALDAHSGAVHPDLLDLAAEIVPQLPALGAVIFEVLPEHVAVMGLDALHGQLSELRSLWSLRRTGRELPRGTGVGEPQLGDLVECLAWETSLVDAIGGRRPTCSDFADLVDDPGTRVYRDLIGEFRRAAAARCLRYTMTALLLAVGRQELELLLERCFADEPAEAFLAVDAARTADWLARRAEVIDRVPHLRSVLEFERALLRAALYGRPETVAWDADPNRVLGALDANVLPVDLPALHSRMRVG